MSGRAEIVSVNVSDVKGTAKRSVDEIVLDERGVAGDAHAGTWHRQVTVLSRERLEAFSARTGRPVGAGDFAENLTIRGLDLRCVAPLDRLSLWSNYRTDRRVMLRTPSLLQPEGDVGELSVSLHLEYDRLASRESVHPSLESDQR